MAVTKLVPVQDGRKSHQRGEHSHRYKARLDGMPGPGSGYTDEEVGAAEIGRAEHHRSHRRPDVPGEEAVSVARPRVQDSERHHQVGLPRFDGQGWWLG